MNYSQTLIQCPEITAKNNEPQTFPKSQQDFIYMTTSVQDGGVMRVTTSS